MKVDEYRKIRADFLESERIRKEGLGKVGVGPIEKSLDNYIKIQAKRGFNNFELWYMLDRIWGDIHKEVPFTTSNEAYENIVAVAKNFCKREGLQFEEDTLIISW